MIGVGMLLHAAATFKMAWAANQSQHILKHGENKSECLEDL